MYRRYRYFVYFLAALVLGSFLLDWLSNSVRLPAPARVDNAPAFEPSPTDIATPPAQPADSFGPGPPPYAPAYNNPAVQDEGPSKARETQSPEQTSPGGMASSSDIQPAPPPPTDSPENPETPDRNGTTTAPKSSNAALREIIKPKGH